MKKYLFVYLQYILPHRLLSRLIGKLAHSKNKTIKKYLIHFFIKKFKINLQDSKITDPNKYESFNEFFIRELKDEIRPLNTNTQIISSPADGNLTQFGDIIRNQLIQAKGKNFSLESLIAYSSKTNFKQFVNIYLSPRDYHRVHMPIDGNLKKMVYIPGKLFSVNEMTTKIVNNIFTKNERLVCYFDTKIGEISIIFIGALIVGSIETVFHSKIIPNYYKEIQIFDYKNHYNLKLKKGDQLGWFHFGSTVIILFPNQNKRLYFKCVNTSVINVKQDLAILMDL